MRLLFCLSFPEESAFYFAVALVFLLSFPEESASSFASVEEPAGWPILAVPLFLRQGWDEQMPARLLPLLFCLSFPEESAFSFASVEEPAGWPILAAFLFLRLGWVSQMPATKFVRSANPYRSPTRMASS